MNIFNLSDAARIRALKLVLLGVTSGFTVISVQACRNMGLMKESRDKNLKLAQLNNKVIQRFVELAPAEVSEQIREEFQFDVVVLDF